MKPAEEALRGWIDDRAEKLDFRDPALRLLSNADGSAVDDGGELRTRLVAQVTRPVRWDRCMVSLGELGVTACVELAPAGALTGLVKRELKGTRTIPVKSPDDLDTVVELLREVTT
jgi:[acyl-carrier-protein] S-malonyltransferase